MKQNHANQRPKSHSLFDVKRHKIGESKTANWLTSGANQAPSGIAPKTLTKGRCLISANPAWLELDAFAPHAFGAPTHHPRRLSYFNGANKQFNSQNAKSRIANNSHF
ncbi:hypothetical protein [Paraburkholderia fungorum]|uniref:hypothetical protein n=1 Tax=Paraburkholderia fungorum TaxID=134537 RepID=UPI0038B75525